MAKIAAKPTVTVHATFVLDEEELLAISAIGDYGIESIIQALASHLSQTVIPLHAPALRRLFEGSRSPIRAILSRATAARKSFETPE